MYPKLVELQAFVPLMGKELWRGCGQSQYICWESHAESLSLQPVPGIVIGSVWHSGPLWSCH